MKWLLVNKLDLVFVVVYQGILPSEYLEKLLEDTKSAFVKQLGGKTGFDIQPIDFNEQFKVIADRCDNTLRDSRKRPMKGYNQNARGDSSLENSSAPEQDEDEDGNPKPLSRKKAGPAPFKKKDKKGKENNPDVEDKKGKEKRDWGGTGKVQKFTLIQKID